MKIIELTIYEYKKLQEILSVPLNITPVLKQLISSLPLLKPGEIDITLVNLKKLSKGELSMSTPTFIVNRNFMEAVFKLIKDHERAKRIARIGGSYDELKLREEFLDLLNRRDRQLEENKKCQKEK